MLLGHLETSLRIYKRAFGYLKPLDGAKADITSTSTLLKLVANGPDRESEKLLDSMDDFTKKGRYSRHRWLRSKALCHWKNRCDLKKAQELFKEAFSVYSKEPYENIITELLHLQILREADEPGYSQKENQIYQYSKDYPITQYFWNNFTQSGNFLPPLKDKEGDIRLKALSNKEVNELIKSFL